ncbi:hypothetical protein BCF59_0459 [Mycoplasmopsis mustelae]|uniref:COF family HAD hydrolase protein n=1 Tax=Mycoplasmopsis mustelae TaxID=171289 RepID=A0A4R7UEI1_9BACT|nr:HAD family hydrolase [Mycoplasmopsis mustelae]TDV24486.1 hypothetical protein BCF59_0459 [Mycoplasmopsis mustelae]
MHFEPYVFAFDLDGTLLQKDNSVHSYTLEIMQKIQQSGHINVIATGRGVAKTLPLLNNKTIDYVDYLVCSNGSCIYDVKKQTTYIINTLDKAIFPYMRKIALDHKLIITIDSADYNATALPDNKVPAWMTDANIMDMNIFNQINLDQMQEIVDLSRTKLTQIALRNPLNQAKQITDLTRVMLKKFDCNIYLTNSIYTDVNPINTSKLIGIEYVLNLLNLTTNNLIAFGDSGNDIEMVLKAKIGVAMQNATSDLIKVADVIIGNHNSATIGEYLEKYITKTQG